MIYKINSLKGCTMKAALTVTVKYTLWLRFRVWLTVKLLILAAKVSGMDIEINKVNDE
jgi:hypothetical protein